LQRLASTTATSKLVPLSFMDEAANAQKTPDNFLVTV
jgi:hypothetical protein